MLRKRQHFLAGMFSEGQGGLMNTKSSEFHFCFFLWYIYVSLCPYETMGLFIEYVCMIALLLFSLQNIFFLCDLLMTCY